MARCCGWHISLTFPPSSRCVWAQNPPHHGSTKKHGPGRGQRSTGQKRQRHQRPEPLAKRCLPEVATGAAAVAGPCRLVDAHSAMGQHRHESLVTRHGHVAQHLGPGHGASRLPSPATPAAARGTAGLNGRGAACGECGATGCVATAALGLRASTECDMDPPWGFDLSLQSQGERTQPTMLSRFSIDTRFLRGILGSCHSLCFVGMSFPANWPANFPLFIHRNCLRGGWLKHVHEDRFLDTKSKGCVKLEVSLVSPLVCPWVVCISYDFFLVQGHAWCLGTSLTSHSCCHCDQLMWHPERKKNASNV